MLARLDKLIEFCVRGSILQSNGPRHWMRVILKQICAEYTLPVVIPSLRPSFNAFYAYIRQQIYLLSKSLKNISARYARSRIRFTIKRCSIRKLYTSPDSVTSTVKTRPGRHTTSASGVISISLGTEHQNLLHEHRRAWWTSMLSCTFCSHIRKWSLSRILCAKTQLCTPRVLLLYVARGWMHET